MRTPSLSEVQSGFLGRLYSGESSPAHILPEDGSRFSIYRAAVFSNLGEALHAVYPVVERLTGGEFFDHAARRFIREFPSASGDLHRYGAQFPAFLESFPPAAALVYLADVARLEWLWHEAFHAADHRPLDLQRLAAIPETRWPRLRLRLQPGCSLLRSAYPVLRIWQTNQPGFHGDDTVNLDEGEVRVLVSRVGYEVAICALGAGEFAFIEAAARGVRLSSAIEAALELESSLDVAALLGSLVAREIIVDVITEPHGPMNGA